MNMDGQNHMEIANNDIPPEHYPICGLTTCVDPDLSRNPEIEKTGYKSLNYMDELVKDCNISIANALEILQCSSKPSISADP